MRLCPSSCRSVLLLAVLTIGLLVISCGGSDGPSTPQNTTPTASFTVTPTSGTTETDFQFDASGCSDAEDETNALEVRWDWENDGTWDTAYATDKTATHRYTTSGTKTVRLEVKDTGGLTKQATESVIVSLPNTAPTASFTVTPTEGTTETDFDFDASGCTDAEDATSELEVRWDWEDDGVWDTTYGVDKSATHRYDTPGAKTIKLEVRDTGDSTDTVTESVTVSAANTSPTASFTVTPGSGTTETDFDFDASACSDIEDPVTSLEVRWDWENDGTWDTEYSTTKTATHRFTSTGTITINMEVKDTGGLTAQTARDVTVEAPNTAPTASFTVTPGSGTTETDFSYDASGCTDAEDPVGSLEVRWDWENDGTWDTGYSTGKITTHQFTATGTITTKLEVRDTGGLTDETTHSVTVSPPNIAPTASFVVTPTFGSTETDFAFDASLSSDPEDPAASLEVRWDWENDGVWDTGYSATKSATYRYSTGGTKTIKMEVKDTGAKVDDTTQIVEVMVVIPAGTFTMGSDPGEGATNEEPEHQPYISAFSMDIHEVTNAWYADALNWAVANGRAYWNGSDVVKSSSDATMYLLVSDSDCRIDRSGSSFVVESGYEQHPVLEISWYGAAAYCNWRSEMDALTPCYDTSTWDCNFAAGGFRLPTEAEWEKAARGSSDERTYTWGEDAPTCGRVNARVIDFCVGGTSPVGSYPTGVSPYGLFDMAGNLWEWCNDWYAAAYYSVSPATDPQGPTSGSTRVRRGGSWNSPVSGLRLAQRKDTSPANSVNNIGFRVARSE